MSTIQGAAIGLLVFLCAVLGALGGICAAIQLIGPVRLADPSGDVRRAGILWTCGGGLIGVGVGFLIGGLLLANG